jgi:hypothetical protein
MNSFEYFQIKCDELAENKLFIGFVMVMVNIGARFIIEELSDTQLEIIKGDIFRKIVIFCSVFMATRDTITSLIITVVVVILLNEILVIEHESSNIEPSTKSSKGSSHVKQELDKQINQLKLIKDSL